MMCQRIMYTHDLNLTENGTPTEINSKFGLADPSSGKPGDIRTK